MEKWYTVTIVKAIALFSVCMQGLALIRGGQEDFTMGLFDFIKKEQEEKESFDAAVARFHETPGAVLLDVRTPDEYHECHIPGSKNVALQAIERVTEVIPEKETPVLVYCRSGARSGRAVTAMKQMGYTKAENIGGIMEYHGELER